jgi:hypothetical protein
MKEEVSHERTKGRVGVLRHQQGSSRWRQWTCVGRTCAPLVRDVAADSKEV